MSRENEQRPRDAGSWVGNSFHINRNQAKADRGCWFGLESHAFLSFDFPPLLLLHSRRQLPM